jgi:glycosyltransferase involved in cell wall biosynthesis
MMRELKHQMPEAVFTGTLSREAVAEAFASADLFVFPSRTDTAGNVVLEAQACGLPVIVSAEGGPRENMIDGKTGTVCHGTDVSEWAGAVTETFRHTSHHRALADAARQFALTRRWDAALQPLYCAYRTLGAVASADTSSPAVPFAAQRAR